MKEKKGLRYEAASSSSLLSFSSFISSVMSHMEKVDYFKREVPEISLVNIFEP